MVTSQNSLKALKSVLGRVFSESRYTLLASTIFFVSLSVVLLLPNITLLGQVFSSGDINLISKFIFTASLYGSIFTNFTLFGAFYTILLILLFSFNLTLLVFYIRRVQRKSAGTKRVHATGVFGMLSGVLGIGCAACGSVILTGLAASVGATGLLLALPLHGGEFALLGILLLSFSITYLVKKINDPLVCPVKV